MLEAKKQKKDIFDKIFIMMKGLYAPLHEIQTGLRLKTIPLEACMIFGMVSYVCILLGLHEWTFKVFKVGQIYPERLLWFHVYNNFWLFSGFIFWGIIQVALRKKLINTLTEVFINAGLKSGLGKLPGFIADRALDSEARKLTLLKNQIPVSSFKSAKEDLEGSLQIYIDAIEDRKEKGTIDIFYAHSELKKLIKASDLDSLKPNTYVVGHTRSKTITTHLGKVPHLMVVGQTDMGKSTFLRQAIVGLYLNNPRMTFTLVDLKEGLEFQAFEETKRIDVYDELDGTVMALNKVHDKLIHRMKLIKKAKCKDIQELALKSYSDLKDLGVDPKECQFGRHMIVVDEVAEMFLINKGSAADRVQEARKVIDKIARQGRAAGFHLMLATQRPDVKSMDPRVKSNLAATMCYPMTNIASSLTAINSRRAFDLPIIKGRAIWQCGYDCFEVQTGYLKKNEAEEIMQPYALSEKEIVKNNEEEVDSSVNVAEVILDES